MRKTVASLSLTALLCTGAAFTAVGALEHADVDASGLGGGDAAAGDDHDLVLTGRVLVASDVIGDASFAGTRIYVLHHDMHGAVGVVLNRPVGRAVYGVPMYAGGPVGRDGVIVLHDDEAAGGVVVEPGVVAAGHEPALMRAIAAGEGPARAKAFVGYAGWGPRQLEHELAAGAWAVVDADADAVFAR